MFSFKEALAIEIVWIMSLFVTHRMLTASHLLSRTVALVTVLTFSIYALQALSLSHIDGLATAHSISCDTSYPWQVGFQDAGTPTFEGIVELHDTIFFYLILVSFLVFWMMGATTARFKSSSVGLVHKYHNHGTFIELVWTVTPAFILIAIAFPSFKLLYLMDELISPTMTIKVAGHQWYWSYEYSDFITEDGEAVDYDSYMVPDTDLEQGQLRLLDVDNRVVVPVDTHVRFIVTAQDVIHDFAVPSLGLKIDCVPGRLNQVSVLIQREGVFYGQCSELCGIYHSMMPIVIQAVSLEDYLLWLDQQI